MEDWKLIETLKPDYFGKPAGHKELFDLQDDPGETRDLSAGEPVALSEMVYQLEDWWQRTLGGEPDPMVTQPLTQFVGSAHSVGGDR